MEKNIKTASKGVRSMYEWLEEIVFALVAVILVFTFLFRVVTVTGKSMLPNFVEGEKVVVTNLGHDIEQGTVVVVTNVLEEPIIKRVIATEGQTVNIDYDTGTVYIDGEALNDAVLEGFLCREPIYRRTPLGREICDVMLAVSRPYHRTDYLPCILWGRTAQAAAQLPPGAQLVLTGRLQSREYVKLLPGGSETRVAYEVSAAAAEAVSAPG